MDLETQWNTIDMIDKMVEEKKNELDRLEEKKRNEKERFLAAIKQIDKEIMDVNNSITVYLADRAKLTGQPITYYGRVILRGIAIGDEAIKALKRLGGEAHYSDVKEEIEKHFDINGINDKSKLDSIWNQLDKRTDIVRLGNGVFKLRWK